LKYFFILNWFFIIFNYFNILIYKINFKKIYLNTFKKNSYYYHRIVQAHLNHYMQKVWVSIINRNLQWSDIQNIFYFTIIYSNSPIIASNIFNAWNLKEDAAKSIWVGSRIKRPIGCSPIATSNQWLAHIKIYPKR